VLVNYFLIGFMNRQNKLWQTTSLPT